ncbi:penicillin-binding protein [Tellurirhabdus bombi]|uniref:penicillin-binding protein n=1 Tax=Tellurirhabdus bombi TaxID=2907205 RepID=UPI001F46269E|nr:penicillin-binding protein [Tellurirhabdus bombi]
MSKADRPVNIKRDILNRAMIASIGLFLFAAAIIGRLVYVQFYQTYKGKPWKARIADYHIRKDTIPASRGNIYSSNGSVMATSLPYYYIGIDPRVAKDEYFESKVDSLGLLLSRKFGEKSRQEYVDLIKSARANKRKYVMLTRRKVTFQERLAILQWPFFNRQKGSGGGKFDAIYQRYNPFGRMALRTVGYLNPESGRGLVGLEASFQKELAGKNGIGMVEVLSGGVKMPIEDGTDNRPEPGLDIHTTIDVNFQDMAESALKNTLESYNAEKGCVIVMEVQTGAIKAMANLSRSKNGYIENFNHGLAGRTDPGSTFKLASMLALLEEKAVRPDQVFNTGGGSVRFRGLPITDAKRGGYGALTAQQIFEKSSNVGVHLMMQSYFQRRPDLYCRYLAKFRLTEPTGFEMKGEAQPVIRNPSSKQWSKVSLAFMALGYEVQLTPLQMLTFYNAVANDGKWVRPMIVQQIRRNNEIVEDFQPYVEAEPIASARSIKQVQSMLKGVVEEGTAKKSKSPNYKFSGKTGTAQKLINGRYQKGKYYTSFIGYFPADKPKYSCVVIVDSPQGANMDLLYGGSVAAPVFREVADRIFAYDVQMHSPIANTTKSKRNTGGAKAGFADDLRTIGSELNIDTQLAADGWVKATGQGARVQWVSQSTKNQVPDLVGMNLRDALHLLENRGFLVRFKGVGKVVDQSVPAGSALPSPRKITLVLQQTARPDTLKIAPLVSRGKEAQTTAMR